MLEDLRDLLKSMEQEGLKQDSFVVKEAIRHIEELSHKLRIAELKNKNSLANNLCSDHRDKIKDMSCLMCTLEQRNRELHKLKTTHNPY